MARRVIAPGTQMQVHLAALPLDLVDLALAVLATQLHRQQLGVPRSTLQPAQQLPTVIDPAERASAVSEIPWRRRAGWCYGRRT